SAGGRIGAFRRAPCPRSDRALLSATGEAWRPAVPAEEAPPFTISAGTALAPPVFLWPIAGAGVESGFREPGDGAGAGIIPVTIGLVGVVSALLSSGGSGGSGTALLFGAGPEADLPSASPSLPSPACPRSLGAGGAVFGEGVTLVPFAADTFFLRYSG